MPEEIIYQQWRNVNENAKYPFSDRATLTNDSATIEQEVFLDAKLYPPGCTETLHLTSIVKDSTSLTINIGDNTSGDLASAEVTISDIMTYNIELLELQDAFGRPAGVLVTEPARLSLLTALPIGTHEFTLDQTEFASTVVTPSPQTGLRSLVVDGETQYDDVWLVGGLGVVLQHRVGDLYGDDIVTINVVGEPLSKRVVCQDSEGNFDTSNYLKYLVIEGFPVHPDDYGDIKLGVCAMDVDDTVLRVLPGTNSITFAAVGGRIG